MSIFKSPSGGSPEPDGPIPVAAIDLSKRYDLYCTVPGEDWLYEDVRIIGIRTFERMRQFSTGLIGGYIEIEARDGTRMMITHHILRIICEHGTKPAYKIIRTRETDDHDAS